MDGGFRRNHGLLIQENAVILLRLRGFSFEGLLPNLCESPDSKATCQVASRTTDLAILASGPPVALAAPLGFRYWLVQLDVAVQE
jgi:hypothetical protein